MKKLLFAAVMLFATSSAFAGDSDALKGILKTKTYSEAASMLQSNLNQLAGSAEKAKAYKHLVDLAMENFNKENDIQVKNLQAQITKSELQPYDTLAYFQAAYDATMAAVECQKYDNEPNEKGQVKPKFTEALAPIVANARMQLVTAGNNYAQKGDQEGVLKYWGTFLDTDNNPLFKASKPAEAGFIGQVALYTAQFANQAKQYDKAEKYADIAMQDSSVHQEALTFKYAMAQRNLKTREDSLNYVNKLKELYAAEPDNEMAFGTLCNMYSGLDMNQELSALVDSKIAKDPNNMTAWALKGQMLMNQNSKMDNPNWDECIDCFKKAVAIDGTNPVILTYLGFSINAKASQINGDRNAQKTFYKESMGYLEKAKELDPNRQKANWAYPLYQCYYLVYAANDPRTLELEKLLKSK
jgi:hypothetical protein